MRRPSSDRVPSERGAMLIQVAVALIALLAFGAIIMDYGVHGLAPSGAERCRRCRTVGGHFHGLWGAGRRRPREGHCRGDGAREWGVRIPAERADDRHQRALHLSPGSPGAGSQGCVRANVFRNESRDPLPMFMGRLFGRTEQGVQAMAVAEILAANEAECLKPWAVADRWDETTPSNGSPGGLQPYPLIDTDWNTDAIFNPGVDAYVPASSTSPGTGYRLYDTAGNLCCDYGLVMQLKGDQPTPRCGIRRSTSTRATARPCTKDAIRGCFTGDIGGTVGVKPGVSHGPTDHGVTDLVNQDPYAYWYNPSNQGPPSDPLPSGASLPPNNLAGCSHGCIYSSGTGKVNSSPRIGAIPIINPNELASPPNNGEVEMTNILGFFVMDVQGNGNSQVVRGRVITIPGKFNPSANSVDNAGSFLKTIILVR